MSYVKGALIACTLAVGSAVVALATEGNFSDGMVFTLHSNGQYAMGKATQRGLSEAMKSARPLPGGVTVIMSGSKIYLADDPKGSLFHMFRDKNMSGG
jgi:hypothetical protein